ncbi:HK97 gp10 family phage protein [Oribacterium sp. FC2011]|uniref:HK97 gp10 family phage protein n=1 Tax=Oribacterium sp. FC2011 TaxID=1408311 RepID=UPI0004E26AA1|nr:HK97 gp10 family phage protein [Oribacterium sp. FC2011]
MATDRVKIDQIAHVIMEGLQEYADLATDDLKKAVKKAGDEAKKDIQNNAPVKTGAYKKSWTVKTTKETSNAMEVVVHSRNRYQLAHLLEFGHAKRGGGRTRAFPHIAPAEQRAAELLEREVEAALK